MKHIKWLIAILIIVLAVIVISENIQNLATKVTFKVDLMFWAGETPQFPLAFILVIAFLGGILLMALCGLMERFRLKKQVRTLTAENNRMEKELNSCKSMPVSTEIVDLE